MSEQYSYFFKQLKMEELQAENERLRNLAKDIYERSKTQMNKDDWEFLFQMPAAKGVQS
jgi:hypothetical protein